MLTDTQVAVLCDVAQSAAFPRDKQSELDRLLMDGYLARVGDVLKLTPKAEKALADRGAGLNES